MEITRHEAIKLLQRVQLALDDNNEIIGVILTSSSRDYVQIIDANNSKDPDLPLVCRRAISTIRLLEALGVTEGEWMCAALNL